MTTVEKLITIAEFMGYKFNADKKLNHNNITNPNEDGWYYASFDLDTFNNYVLDNFKYASSWDALMPAISKFNLLDSQPEFDYLPSEYYHIRIRVDSAVTTYVIEEAFNVFVIAIEWYNKQKQSL